MVVLLRYFELRWLNFITATIPIWWQYDNSPRVKDHSHKLCLIDAAVVEGCLQPVTSLGDLLNFGQLFKAFGNN